MALVDVSTTPIIRPEKPRWGPWSIPWGIDEHHDNERKAQFRTLATLVYTHRLKGQADVMPLVIMLRAAEVSEAAAERARRMFDLLPALVQRQIIATYNSVTFLRQDDINAAVLLDVSEPMRQNEADSRDGDK